MKIAYDGREAFGMRAGKGQVAYHLLCALMRIDSENEYFVFLSEPSRMNMPKNFHEVIVVGKGPLWHFNAKKEFTKRRLDVYFSPTSYIVAAIASFKTVILVHDMVAFLKLTKHQAKATWVERATLKAASKKCRAIMAVSESSMRDLVNFFPSVESKVHVAHPAQARSEFSYPSSDGEKESAALGLVSGYILFVGTIEPRKNIDGMLRAFKEYKEKVGNEARKLVIVGKKGWHYEATFALVKELGLENDVVFTGFVTDAALPYLYKNAGCFFFPSWYEGFGLILLEALALGCPVISSNTSSMPEVVGDAAIMVSPSDTTQMAEALEKVLSDEGLRKELIQKGFVQEKKFTWDDMAKKTLRVILEAHEK